MDMPDAPMAAPAPAGMPPMAPPVTHDVTIVTTKKVARARVMGVPPEEFGIERGARSVAESNYCFHEVVTKTEAQLIEEGYDDEQVKKLETYNGISTTETQSRDTVSESMGAGASGTDSGTRLVKYTEHYIRMDYEGKGRTCLYMVVGGGSPGFLLKKDGEDAIYPIDAMPFAAVTPVPQPHRFFGRSVADLVMDIQRIKTALMRGMLDNMYLHINPRVEVSEANAGPNTLDDLLVSRPGGIVRTKTSGGLQWQVVPDITGSIYPALEYMDSTREMRTGVTRQGQGVDANALQNQSATAVNQVFTMAQARMKLIARIIAETGVKDLFSLLHGVIRKHGQQSQTVRLRNKWVSVDPRNWKTRDDMTIHVGLGNGGRSEQFAQTMGIANFQKELLLGGKTNLVGDRELYNTAAQLAKLAGHKNPNQFFNDPTEKNPDGSLKNPPAQPQPDPSVQVAQLKAQTDQQNMNMQAQLDERADQRKAQIETTQAQADIATQERKTQAEMIQSEREFQLKKELAVMEFELQAKLKQQDMQMRHAEHEQRMQQSQASHEQAMASGAFKAVQGQQAHEQKMEMTAAQPKAGE